MSAEPRDIAGWRTAGCGVRCSERGHDPLALVAYGFLLGNLANRPRAVRTGPLVVDLDACRAIVNGDDIRLTDREWSVLAYLAGHVGQHCANDDILAAAWGPEWVTGQRDRRGDRTDHHYLRVVLCRLRTKLGPAAQLISTARSVSNSSRPHGYRLARVVP